VGVYIDGQGVEGLGQGERPLAQFGLGGGVGVELELDSNSPPNSVSKEGK